MKPDSKLSVIVPVYNGEKYITHTVKNILLFSYHNREILLIDDGSTNRSPVLCDNLAESDSRIRVFHKANGGIADARNYGLEHATGTYIGFCDQDDEISNEMYQKMMIRIASDNSQMAICGCYRQKRNGDKVIFEQYTDDVLELKSIREKLLLPMLFKGFAVNSNQEVSIYTSIWKCIISKQLINQHKLRFHTFINYEDDFIMLLQLFPHAIKNGITPEIIAQYTYVQQCRNALLHLDNLSVSGGRKTSRDIKELLTCNSISYICSAHNAVTPAKGFIRNTIIIPLLRRKHVITAYLMNQLINILRLFVEKYQITERLERRLKRNT